MLIVAFIQRVIECREERGLVADLGATIGFGRLMQLAQECWAAKLADLGQLAGGELVVGTAKAMTVPCICRDPPVYTDDKTTQPRDCDWCCGAGWLTKAVRDLIIAQHTAVHAERKAILDVAKATHAARTGRSAYDIGHRDASGWIVEAIEKRGAK